MRNAKIPLENIAQMIWGALLIIYLISAGRGDFLQWPVLTVFGVSAAAALFELYLRRRQTAWVPAYDVIVWTVMLSAMVAVTGGRSSEVWPAYLLMSLTAPILGRAVLHYGLMAVNSLFYAAVYTWINPGGTTFQPGLLLLRVGLFFLVIYIVDRAMARERTALEQAVQASRSRVAELVSARDAERREIAHDLHDWLGTGLVAPMRKLELALRAPDQTMAGARTTEALDTLRRSHDELRRVMERLHPHLLEQMGVTEALRAYLTTWSEEHGITVAFDGHAGTEPAPDVALTAYRIMQEALNNIAKHAGASHVAVGVTVGNNQLTLTVEDDGAGFDPAMLPPASGRGLAGMNERAAAHRGKVIINSAPDQGATVTAHIPLGGQSHA